MAQNEKEKNTVTDTAEKIKKTATEVQKIRLDFREENNHSTTRDIAQAVAVFPVKK